MALPDYELADRIPLTEPEQVRALGHPLRNQILGLTERGQPLVAWRAEHGPVGHKAEEALLAAALAITAGDALGPQRATLLRPMAEALPWLLPAAAP